MNELRRMAYLAALGIDSYVSRVQLPGAAPTRRLAIVTKRPAPVSLNERSMPRIPGSAPSSRRAAGARPGQGPVAPIEYSVPTPPVAEPPPPGTVVPRFSLTAIVAGHWLWLEDLAGMPLTQEQVHLVQSMAQALLLHREPGINAATAMARPDVAQFAWPIHTNNQLDLGVQAAQAAVAGFINRRLEQHGCRGLVLLGQPCAQWVPQQALDILTVSTASSAQILAQPELKREVWRALQPLVGKL